MSEHTPDHDIAPVHDTGTEADRARDTDADPQTLNPRGGGQASGGPDREGDPDADPDMLNPRTGDSATSGDEL